MLKVINKYLYNRVKQHEDLCNICLSSKINRKRIDYLGEVKPPAYVKNRSMVFKICEDCGYSFCKENFKDYLTLGSKSISSIENCKRVGSRQNKGREFFMANGAIAILKKKKLRILVFAPGNSLDHQTIRELDSVDTCKVTDLSNFQESEHFIPLDTKEQFDIVIACEVVEHFMEPRKEFFNLFRYLDKDGLLMISTDTRVEDAVTERLYPFLYGHTSYYSGKSLIFLAGMNDIFIDFRTPEGETFNSKIKRYIYMTKSKNTHLKIIDRFSIITHPMAE